MAQAGQVFVNFGANTQGLLAGTARAGNILRRFSQTGVGAAIVMGASFVTLSRIMTGFATSAVAGFKDFEYHIVRAKALSGATAGEFIKMSGTAEELGRTTEFMAKDIAAGMSNLALAGFNANEIIKMIPDSLRLATAGGVALAKTNTIMANAIRGFSLEADQANQVANVLTATFTTTNTTLESLAQTFKNAVGVLATLGVKMEEVAAAAGVLGDVGINASVAGTGLKNFGIKLAKTFGMLKDGAKSARDFFESLGVTKERLFDAETGTLNMVEAVRAFKESMDKLGAARAPEFLAQFAKLFGARAAASLTALVRQAEAFQIQAENTRLTEMVGDVQKVFENMQKAAGQTLYMTSLQKGLHVAVKGMVDLLGEGNTIMEEFTEHGGGARRAIERLSVDFEQTSKILRDTFGDTNVFTKTTDGLLKITKFSKNNSKEMIKYGEILDKLSKMGKGDKRILKLKEEAAIYKKIIESTQRTVKEMTALGRARTLTLAAQIKSLRVMESEKGGRSKAVLQLEALNRMYKGNEKNILLAANALGIQVKKGDKLAGTLGRVKSQLLDTTTSIDKQNFAMQRWVSQAAMTNTAMDMQRTQLETLDGTFKLFKSGLELVSNKIAKALAPALDSSIKSVTVFLRALTLNNEEIARGVTATEKLNDALNETFKIFKKDGGVLKEMKKGFEGLSSIGKTLAATMGILGASGLAAGGAFIWIQALGPALMALAGTFFTMVLPISVVVATVILLGIELKKARDSVIKFGDNAEEKGHAMVGIYLKIKEKIDLIRDAYDKMIVRLEDTLKLTNKLNVVGGKFSLFEKGEDGKILTIKKTIEELEGAFSKLEDESKTAGDALIAAFRVGNAAKVNDLLRDNSELMDAIATAGLKSGFATESQTKAFVDVNTLLESAEKNLKSMEESAAEAQMNYDKGVISMKALEEANKKAKDAQEEVNDFLKRRDGLYNKIVGQQGRIGKLTDGELKKLKAIKDVIGTQQKAVEKTQKTYEAQIRLQDKGKGNLAELTKASKAYKKEHELLVDSQKKYNDILNKATERNPFGLMAKKIKEIMAGNEFQGFLANVAIGLTKLMDLIFIVVAKVGPSVWNLLKVIGKVVGAVFSVIGTLISRILDKALGGTSILDVIADIIDKVAVKVEEFAKAINEMSFDKLKKFGLIGIIIFAAFQSAKMLFLVFEKIGMAIAAMGGRASKMGNALKTMFGPLIKAKEGATGLTVLLDVIGLLKNVVVSSFGAIALWIGIAIALVASLVEAWKKNYGDIRGATKGFVTTLVSTVVELFVKVWTLLKRLTALIWVVIKVIMKIGKVLAPIIGPIVALLLNIVKVIIAIVMGLINKILGVINWFIGLVTDILNSKFVSVLFETVGHIVKMIYDVISGIINFIKFAVGKVLEFISPFTDWIGGIIDWVWGKIKGVFGFIGFVIKILWESIVDIFTFIMKIIGKIAKGVSAIFTWDKEKMYNGLIAFYKVFNNIFLKAYEFVLTLVGKVKGFAIKMLFAVLSFFADKLANVLGYIPAIGEGLKKGLKGVSEDLKKASSDAMDNAAAKAKEKVKEMTDTQLGFVRELERKRDEAKAAKEKAQKETEAQEVGKKKVKDKVGEKVEKQDVQAMQMENIAASMFKTEENTKTTAENTDETDKRAHVTNNTVVEYKAAEDDEVNRRMIERIMNDVLKAGVGMDMGDAAAIGE